MNGLRWFLQAIGAVCLAVWMSQAIGLVDVLIWIGPHTKAHKQAEEVKS